MGDLKELTDAQLEAMRMRAGLRERGMLNSYGIAAFADREALLASHAALAARLAEAEREIDRLVKKLDCPANARDDE